MASKYLKGMLPTLIILFVLVLSGCQLSYSTPPATEAVAVKENKATKTAKAAIAETFAQPLPTGQDPMAMVGDLATGSAIAMLQTAGTIIVTTPQPVSTTPSVIEVVPVNGTPGTPTSTLPVVNVTIPATSAAVVSTPVPGSIPGTYTLQNGEFPYCIARRFNVNPDELLSLNGLYDGGLFMPGLTLRIPQTGNPFPAARALRPHPATYVVASTGETFSSVACLYGDVDPSAIASYNSLSVGSALSVGQTLQIP